MDTPTLPVSHVSHTERRSSQRRLCLQFLACLCLMIAAAIPSAAIMPIDYAIQLSVQTQKNPPTITLNWLPKAGATGYTISRRGPEDNDFYSTGWIQIASLDSTATSYSDTSVAVGARYEYWVNCNTSSVTATGYVTSGIEAPLTEDRGKLVLLVDNTMTTPLQFELERLIQDLTGDGWTVIRHDVSRAATNTSVRNLIVADYQADPTKVKSVFLFGHLPLFHSGSTAPDGHNSRPWPSDQFYGDMDQEWPDYYYYGTPSQIELQTGRVDLWDMPSFAPLTETDLLRRYLNKDHNYRQRLFNVQMKGIIDDNFGSYGEGFAQNGWRNFPLFVGTSNTIPGDWTTTVTTPYLWAYGCGPGNYQGAGGVCSTPDLKTYDPAVFTFLFGSYFGQWDVTDCFLRGELATPNYGLICGWAGRPNWFVHHMALGETIGYSTLRTMNNYSGWDYQPGYLGLQVCLMGDPTLRTFMIAPPSAPLATPDDLGEVTLTWSPTPDTVLGYHVYRATSDSGPYTRITETPVLTTSYHDSLAPVGNVYYMVRAVALQTSYAGSFYNASQGIFASCNVPFINIPTVGRRLWLKAGAGITTDASNLVSTWADSSGSGNNLSQSVPAQKPVFVANAIGTRSSVRFDGNDDVLNSVGPVITGTSPFTTVTQVKLNSSTLPQTLFWQGDGSATGGYGAYLSGSANVTAGWSGSSAEVTSTASASSGKWYRVVTSYDSSTHKVFVDGSLAGSAAKNDSNFTGGVFSLGNYGPAPSMGLNGEIAEALVYDHALSNSELTDVDNYLKNKYGKPLPAFSATPETGVAPRAVVFDASTSSDPDGNVVSYSWDFGDHTTGAGSPVSHTYPSAGSYTATLTVTDDDGQSSASGKIITVCPPLSSVSLTPNPTSPTGVGSTVTSTAGCTGGYMVSYKIQINDGTGWQTLRDYDPATTCTWTPSAPGSYLFKVWAKSAESAAIYDAESTLTYVVAEIPIDGLRLWLRSDAGVNRSGSSVTSWADQSGVGNTVSQSYGANMPTFADNVLNGRPAVRFAGKNCVLQSGGSVVTGNGGFTVFTVARFLSMPGTNYQYLWWNGTNNSTAGYGPFLSTSSLLRTGWGSYSYALTYSGTPLMAKWYRMCSRYISGTHEMWVDGSFIGQNAKTGSSLASGFAVGNYAASASYQGFYGDIAEIVIYNRKLNETERLAVEQYLAGKWTPPSAVTTDKLGQVRTLAGGTPVLITSPKVVTASSSTFSDGSVYIEDPDRSSGIKLIGATASLWENLTLTGVVDTDSNGERIIRVQSIDTRTPGTDPGVLGMLNRTVAGSGAMVRVWGLVTERVSGYFTIDDGSGVPVRVDLSGLATTFPGDVQAGYYVGVTGIAGLDSSGRAVVKPRGDFDVNVFGN